MDEPIGPATVTIGKEGITITSQHLEVDVLLSLAVQALEHKTIKDFFNTYKFTEIARSASYT